MINHKMDKALIICNQIRMVITMIKMIKMMNKILLITTIKIIKSLVLILNCKFKIHHSLLKKDKIISPNPNKMTILWPNIINNKTLYFNGSLIILVKNGLIHNLPAHIVNSSKIKLFNLNGPHK